MGRATPFQAHGKARFPGARQSISSQGPARSPRGAGEGGDSRPTCGAFTAPGQAVCRGCQTRRLSGVESPVTHDSRPTRTRPAIHEGFRPHPQGARIGVPTERAGTAVFEV